MSQRKQIVKNTSSEKQQSDEDAKEDGATDQRDKEELSVSFLSQTLARTRRRRERENNFKPKEMTEEEEMDLAVRLSEQEANVSALRLEQEEEEDIRRAIQQSMISETQPTTQDKTRLSSKGKLSNSKRKRPFTFDGSSSQDLNTAVSSGAKVSAAEGNARNKKGRRRAGSPLVEIIDISQTQTSPCRSEGLSAAPDSQQSSDSTQIDDFLLHPSPVFPSTGCRAEVIVDCLDQLQGDRASAHVPDSQRPTSPDSPIAPECSITARPKMGVFSEADGGVGDMKQSPDELKSPVLEGNAESSSRAQISAGNLGFMFSSQESSTPSVRSISPVFPRSPSTPTNTRLSPHSSKSAFLKTSNKGCSTGSMIKRKTESDSDSQLQGSHGGAGPSGARQLNTDRHQGDICHSDSPQSVQPMKESRVWKSAETKLSSDMTLVLTDEDEDETPPSSPSLTVSEERNKTRAKIQTDLLNHKTAACPGPNHSLVSEVKGASPSPEEAERATMVHYYWGIPFCPRGLDPDTYTQVILAQMEVYEKSLKQAQRSLMTKAKWGEPVLPEPEKSESPPESPQPHASGSVSNSKPPRLGLRRRKRVEEEKKEEIEGEEEQTEKEKHREEEEEVKDSGGADDQMETEDCDVCPETQLSNDNTQVLMIPDPSQECPPESPEIEVILPDNSRENSPKRNNLMKDQNEEEEQEEVRMEENHPGGPTESDEKAKEATGDPEELEVVEIKVGGRQRSSSPGLDLPSSSVLPRRSSESSVDCPICQRSFPAGEIEVHAAYCDPEETHKSKVTLKSRRMRLTKADLTSEETNDSPDRGRICQEKCYVCHRDVALKDYSLHTELCIQRQSSKTTTRGNLLSALERTESRGSDAVQSGSKHQLREVIDLRDDEDDEEQENGGVSGFKLSDSPIKSFTSISEATDCLVDFRKQQPRAKNPGRRRR